MKIVDGPEAIEGGVHIDEVSAHQGGDEVAVLLSERAELRDAEVFLVEAPPGELWLAGGCSGVGVLHSDETIAPARRQRAGVEVDAVDAEAVELLEG